MYTSRRDKKNRKLHNGEIQLADGRYRYKYIDELGKSRYVYSKRLVPNDPAVHGKKEESLREKIARIQKDKQDKIAMSRGDMTVLALVELYISQKIGVKPSTRLGYKTVVNFLKKDPFGKRKISSVKTSDARGWLIDLQKNGRGYSSIHSIRGVLRPAFRLAYEDDFIRKNPFDFELASVLVNDSVTRQALTRKQERLFLEFVRKDAHYQRVYEGIFILFNTGLRISEFVGLTIGDIDFEHMIINVDHQLVRVYNERKSYIIQKTKTTAGVRKVPMTPEVADCFRKIIKNRKKVKKEPVVDGYKGFLYLDQNGMPMVALHWEKYFQFIREKYNKLYKEPLPTVTPHVCRHTFCTKMAKSGMNPAKLKYIMGHSSMDITFDTYTHLQVDDVRDEMLNIAQMENNMIMQESLKTMEFCGCRCEVEKIWKRDTVWWNEKLVGYVKEVAEEMEIKHQFIHSGAGHDAQFISYMVPTTMIFAPSVKGLSHCEDEYTSVEHCTLAASVMLNAVLKADSEGV